MGGDHLAIVHPLGGTTVKSWLEWVNQRRYMLEQCGIEISDTDFTDDRLAIVLRQLSQEPTWQAIEQTSAEILCASMTCQCSRCAWMLPPCQVSSGG